MRLKDVTHQQTEEFLETVRGSVDCTVKVFSLGEYSILYSYNDSSQHASVSHSHKEVGLKVTKIIITQLLKTRLENVQIFRIPNSSVVHFHINTPNDISTLKGGFAMRCAIYARVSTEEQATEGYSISAQKKRLASSAKPKIGRLSAII